MHCSKKQYWCCSCTLGSNYSRMVYTCFNTSSIFFVFIELIVVFLFAEHLFFSSHNILCLLQFLNVSRSILWIPKSGMPFSQQYLEVSMVHFVASERLIQLPLFTLFNMLFMYKNKCDSGDIVMKHQTVTLVPRMARVQLTSCDGYLITNFKQLHIKA